MKESIHRIPFFLLELTLKGLAFLFTPKLQATRLQHSIVTMGSGKPGRIQLTCSRVSITARNSLATMQTLSAYSNEAFPE